MGAEGKQHLTGSALAIATSNNNNKGQRKK